jgi:outer membrane protease
MSNIKTSLEPQNQPSCLGAVISRFIYLITNETDMTVESAWSNYEDAKKECQQWEKMKPQKQFMVVELPINGI